MASKYLGLFAVALAVITCGVVYNHHYNTNEAPVGNDAALYDTYIHWANKNNIRFGGAEDKTMRFAIFKNNVRIIEEHNSNQSSYVLGLTPFAHLTLEEFSAAYLGFNGAQRKVNNKVVAVSDAVAPNDAVDWTTKGAVTGIKNQGQCGSCWSFSATGSLEGRYFIDNNNLLSFSEQELVDCSGSYGNQGCNGGLMDYAFEYVHDNGISTEEAYPYTATDGSCHPVGTKYLKGVNHVDVPVNSNAALISAIALNPVSVAIEADTSVFQLYTSGVITGGACGTSLDHGVLAVGYGTENNAAYIKVKNSWGPSWGANGFVLIGQADGAGVCGINQAASYPTKA